MSDLALVLALTALGTLLGLPVALLLPARFPWRPAAAPALGAGLAAVVVSGGYVHGLAPGAALAVLATLAAASAAFHAWRALAAWRADPGEARAALRGAAPVAGAWAVATLLMLAPRWAGGDQFAVFQGNQWDTFAYLQSALVYAREPHQAVEQAGKPEFRRNPMLAHAKENLTSRPGVHLLYAAMSRLSPRESHRLHYAFLVALLALVVPATLFALRGWLPRARPLVLCGIALVFPLGFWGQYVLDINAWSQTSATAILVVLTALLVDAVALPEGPSPAPLRGAKEARGQGPSRPPRTVAEGLRVAAVIAAAVAGALFLYPEALVYHLVVLLPAAVVVIAWRARRRELDLAAGLTPLAGVAGLAAGALQYGATLAFAGRQFAQSQGKILPFWQFFQAFFGGRDGWDGNPFDRFGDLVAGLYGLYFATPAKDAAAGVAFLQRAAILAVAGGATAAVIVLLRPGAKGPDRHERSRLRVAGAAALLLLVPAAYLALKENYWPAGKGVSFAAPIFMALLAVPVAFAAAPRLSALRWAAAALAAFQLAAGVARLPAVASTPNAFYDAPYPSTQDPRLKRMLSWDLGSLAAGLTGVRRVLIQPMNTWSETYAMLFLSARGVEFAPLGKVNTYYGSGEDLGASPPPWEADASLAVTRDGWLLSFRDGRPAALAALPRVR
jgi:hypothetical protein